MQSKPRSWFILVIAHIWVLCFHTTLASKPHSDMALSLLVRAFFCQGKPTVKLQHTFTHWSYLLKVLAGRSLTASCGLDTVTTKLMLVATTCPLAGGLVRHLWPFCCVEKSLCNEWEVCLCPALQKSRLFLNAVNLEANYAKAAGSDVTRLFWWPRTSCFSKSRTFVARILTWQSMI